ncbi:nucleotide-diphospho-sugar transferase [Sporodiniella umbellata]|nr:nucleotide-diphospho-sugar transferase [Sporodiniella umbellata]
MVTQFKAAWAIVLTSSNNYIKGVITMKQALENQQSQYPLLILYTSQVKSEIVKVLESIGCLTKKIESIRPQGKVNYTAQRFVDTWTKLAVWNETEYDRLVMLDADMLPTQNMDELMRLVLPQGWIAASFACTCNPQKIAHYPPHWTPESCAYTGRDTHLPPMVTAAHNYFNSGLIVLRPEQALFKSMVDQLNAVEDLNQYPFPDQDFLNQVFQGRWEPISYGYNALKTLPWAHPEMWSLEHVKNIHYILNKPWDMLDHQELSDLELHYLPLYELWGKHYSESNHRVDLKRLDALF